jgi:hypothetical protein
MDLFPNTMVQVVDDAEGGIRYWPGVVAPTGPTCRWPRCWTR